MVAALVVVGVWTMLPRTDGPAPADAEPAAAADTPPGLRPPPARGRESTTGSWQVVENFAVRSGPKGHTVLFTATNRGSEAADPGDLQVTAGYLGRPALDYRATCLAVDPRWQGPRTLTDTVEPRRTVVIRCRDTTRYAGAPPALDRSSIEVRRVPCESEGSSLPM